MTQSHLLTQSFSKPALREAAKFVGRNKVWPRPRAAMKYSLNIQERMADDIETILHFKGKEAFIESSDLVRVGWTRQQIDSHGYKANRQVDLRRAQEQQDAAERA